jgi:hypothetical protein
MWKEQIIPDYGKVQKKNSIPVHKNIANESYHERLVTIRTAGSDKIFSSYQERQSRKDSKVPET